MARHSAFMEAPPTAFIPKVNAEEAPVMPGTLGYEAVYAAGYAKRAKDNADYFSRTGTPAEANFAREQYEQSMEYTIAMLDGMRSRISSAPRNSGTEKYLSNVFGNAFNEARSRGARHTSVRDWLADKDHGATNRQLYDFASAHIQAIEARQQHPDLVTRVENAKKFYDDGVRNMVDMGAYVPEVLGSLERIRNARVLLGDYWDQYIMVGAQGYRFGGKDYVVLGQQVDLTDTNLRSSVKGTLLHEFDHLLFSDDMNKLGMPTFFREAMAEHSRLAMETGYWHIINPYLRQSFDSGVYTQERLLLDSIINDGSAVIDPALAMRAHSAPPGHSAWDEYLTAIYKAWGLDIHVWAQERIDKYTAQQLAQGVSALEAKQAAFGRVRSEMPSLLQSRRRAATTGGSHAKKSSHLQFVRRVAAHLR